MTLTRITYASGIAILAFLCALIVLSSQRDALAGAPSGLPAVVATSSLMTISSTASLIEGTSTCSARIITTNTAPISITFSDKLGYVPSATYGHLQLGSTTVAYDSGQYGCGALRVYSYAGAGTITYTNTN
jgi:hypothetical protein